MPHFGKTCDSIEGERKHYFAVRRPPSHPPQEIRHNRNVEIPFALSQRSTIGVEWELALVDRETRALAPEGHNLLSELAQRHSEFAPRLSKELLLNTIELDTGVHTHAGEAAAELETIARAASDLADERGLRIIGAGTHPFAIAVDEPYTTSARYNHLIDRTQWWGRAMLIYGIHVHVGIERRDAVFPVLRGLLPYYPHLLAISASSPFWEGATTGYASNRTMIFQQLPTAGLPYPFTTWTEYEAFIEDMFSSGVIEALTENRWDVRPAAHFGTLELRISDAVSTTREIAAIAALAQSLVDWLYGEITAGREVLNLAPWQVRENKWRAARFGVDTNLIVSRDNAQEPLLDSLRRLVETLTPTAERLGCLAELHDAITIATEGPSYKRQLAVADAAGGNLDAVVDSLADEFDHSVHH